jgi:FlaA1/EpsC-like NDP-sugar epimerase
MKKIFPFLKYTGPAFLSRLLILSLDILLAFLSFHLASLLRLNFDFSKSYSLLAIPIIIVLLVRILSFRWFKPYSVIVRYAGLKDILNNFYAVTGGSLFLIGLSIILRPYGFLLPISILIIDYFLLLTAMAAVRLMMPSLFNIFFGQKKSRINVLIVGAGRLGAMTNDVIRKDINAAYNVVAFIDDNKDVQEKSLDGIPVFSPNKITELVNEYVIEKAIFAIQNIENERKNELVYIMLRHGMKVLQVPFQSSWIHEDFKLNQLKEIQIEDLLNRPVIALDEENLKREYKGKRIMITGGAGSIGSEIIRQLIKFKPAQILLVDQAETPVVNMGLECREEFDFKDIIPIVADVTDEKRIEEVFNEYTPQIVFHAAAYKHVPIMEAYPREAVNVNVKGSKILALLADQFGIEKFVMVSTDKAVNPTNVMGASKRIAEIFIQSLNKISKTKYITTRFGNVLGSNGSVVPRFKKQIAKGGPITVTHKDITRYFMTIPEASLLVLEAGAMGNGGEIFLFDMGEPVKISDLAARMISLSGLQPDVDIKIKYTGLRPGEKLYEELLSTTENSIETHHPKITKARVREYDFVDVNLSIDALIQSVESNDAMNIVGKMKVIVPEFISNNSIFKSLDTSVKKNERHSA